MKEIYALYISLAALIVSAFSLGWNFYRDVILKPRLKVTLGITRLESAAGGWEHFIMVLAVNLGPGPIICDGIWVEEKHFLHFWEKRIPLHPMVDFNNARNTPLPKKIGIGDSIREFLKVDAFLPMVPTHIGVSDAFDRIHWTSTKSLKKTQKDFFKEFRKQHKS